MKNFIRISAFVFALLSACKPASPISSSAQSDNQAESKNAAFYAKDENSSASTLSLDQAGSDTLLKNGLEVFRETVTSVSSLSTTVTVSFTDGEFLLTTRIHESGAREDWKASTIHLQLSELEITRDAGSVEHYPFVSGAAEFELSAGEAVSVSWFARVSPENAMICPYYPSVIYSGLMGGSPVIHQYIEGSSLTGNFKRTIDVGASFPLVEGVYSSDNQSVGEGAVQPTDLDFGCNGILQSMN